MKKLFSRWKKKSKKERNTQDVSTLPNVSSNSDIGGAAAQSLDKEESESKHLLVAAFDFGTTFSGFAFSFRDEPMRIQTPQWNSGKMISLKTPTCLLLTPEGEFDSFGYEAEDKYTNLLEDKSYHGWFLFERFKMLLHNNQNLTRETTVEDVNGNSLPALTVFSMSIRYMKEQMVSQLHKRMPDFSELDIKYVLTVPAIWSDKAKQFMREAGIKAGIDSERLMLALEPEAASIWCQTIPTEAGKCLSGTGTQYMVVDLGGGTVDMSVHEKISNGFLKQLHKASGGPWGGCAVDKNYLTWLLNVFGKPALERFKKEFISDFLEILREFELKKRKIKLVTTSKVNLRLPASLRELHQECEHRSIEDTIAEKGLENMVTCSGDRLRVDASIVKEWFKDPINQIVMHIKEILAEPKMAAVDIILLVGGFGECELVQEHLRMQLPNKRLVIPEDAGLVVLKGALRFGHFPGIVTERVAAYTYGMNTRCVFDPNIHPSSKLTSAGGIHYAEDVFGIFVKQGEVISVGHEEMRLITPTSSQETQVNIFISPQSNPRFVDEPGCQRIGSVKVSHPENVPLENKEFEVTFYFGDTELHVTVRMLNSNKQLKTIIDCL